MSSFPFLRPLPFVLTGLLERARSAVPEVYRIQKLGQRLCPCHDPKTLGFGRVQFIRCLVLVVVAIAAILLRSFHQDSKAHSNLPQEQCPLMHPPAKLDEAFGFYRFANRAHRVSRFNMLNPSIA